MEETKPDGKQHIRIKYHEGLKSYFGITQKNYREGLISDAPGGYYDIKPEDEFEFDINIEQDPLLYENTIELETEEGKQRFIKIPDVKPDPKSKCGKEGCGKKKLIHTASNLQILGIKNPHHDFESVQKKPEHTAYKVKNKEGKDIMKYCYINLPTMRLGHCDGKDGDKDCQNYIEIQKNLSKTTKTQGARYDLEEERLEQGLHKIGEKFFLEPDPDEQDEITDYTESFMVPKLHENMRPEALMIWLNEPENWTALLNENKFGAITLLTAPNAMVSKEIKNHVTKLPNDDLKKLLIKYIFYYHATYVYFRSEIQDLTKIQLEARLEKNPKEIKNWVKIIAHYSGWYNQEWKQKNSILIQIENNLKKPKETDPVIPILLCNLFSCISEQIPNFDA
jgi:hypothetical protein